MPMPVRGVKPGRFHGAAMAIAVGLAVAATGCGGSSGIGGNQTYNLGYIQRLAKSASPNDEKNLIGPLRHPAADPNRDFTVPWQSGMTGLIVNTKLAPDVNSICDLFDPKYKGKVDMLTELRDTVPMTLKCIGIDPDHATTEQWLAAVDKVKQAADSGQIRRFTG